MIKITNLGHASFKIESNSGTVIFDPYQTGSVPGLTYPAGQECDFLLVSHEHFDHNARDQVKINPGKTLSYQEHMVAHDKNGGKERGLTKIFIVYLDGLKIAHLGDMCDVSNTKILDYLKGMDLILCPINNFYTMGPDEARILFDYCKPKLIIPMHYKNPVNNSGYEDGNQIDRFMKFFPNYMKVNETTISLDDYLNKVDAVIFENALQ